jgi:hypothetical protein
MALVRLIPIIDWLTRLSPEIDGTFAQNICPKQECIRETQSALVPVTLIKLSLCP